MIEEKTAGSQAIAAAKEQKQTADSGAPTMHVKVYSPFKVYYDEQSYSISGRDATGPFDILPHHHNFMALLESCILAIKPVEGNVRDRKIRISGGLMHVKADKVIIFLDI
jgi:F0F1-type ATP synthase epsilon subunit